MRKLRKGLSMMVNRKLALGFASWTFNVALRKDREASVGHMSRALSFFINRELARGWVGWHSMWSESVAKRASMRKSLGHFLNRELSAGGALGMRWLSSAPSLCASCARA